MAPTKKDKGKGVESSHRDGDRFDRMADIMERMMDRLDRQEGERERASGTPPVVEAVQVPAVDHSFTAFRAANPPRFNGQHDPDRAIGWVLSLEQIFAVVPCTEERQVQYAGFMLSESAGSWWTGAKRMLTQTGGINSWRAFKELFISKYVPESVKRAKDMQFLKLEQGKMTVG